MLLLAVHFIIDILADVSTCRGHSNLEDTHRNDRKLMLWRRNNQPKKKKELHLWYTFCLSQSFQIHCALLHATKSWTLLHVGRMELDLWSILWLFVFCYSYLESDSTNLSLHEFKAVVFGEIFVYLTLGSLILSPNDQLVSMMRSDNCLLWHSLLSRFKCHFT